MASGRPISFWRIFISGPWLHQSNPSGTCQVPTTARGRRPHNKQRLGGIGDHIVFSIERDHSRGPIEKERVEALNEPRSHLARSAFVAARLRLQRARGANEALTAIGLPALLLGQDGTVIEANP